MVSSSDEKANLKKSGSFHTRNLATDGKIYVSYCNADDALQEKKKKQKAPKEVDYKRNPFLYKCATNISRRN